MLNFPTDNSVAFLAASAQFIRDTKEQKLYSYVKDSEGKPVRLTKPIDRGITGSILSESSGYFTSKVFQSNVWSHELDELPDYVTLCYLAWPIWDVRDLDLCLPGPRTDLTTLLP